MEDKMTRKEMIERLMKGEDPLDLSIEKWEDIVEHLKKISSFEEYDERLEKGQYNCALCELYLKMPTQGKQARKGGEKVGPVCPCRL